MSTYPHLLALVLGFSLEDVRSVNWRCPTTSMPPSRSRRMRASQSALTQKCHFMAPYRLEPGLVMATGVPGGQVVEMASQKLLQIPICSTLSHHSSFSRPKGCHIPLQMGVLLRWPLPTISIVNGIRLVLAIPWQYSAFRAAP